MTEIKYLLNEFLNYWDLDSFFFSYVLSLRVNTGHWESITTNNDKSYGINYYNVY